MPTQFAELDEAKTVARSSIDLRRPLLDADSPAAVQSPVRSLYIQDADEAVKLAGLVNFWQARPVGLSVFGVELSWPLLTRYCALAALQVFVFILSQIVVRTE